MLSHQVLRGSSTVHVARSTNKLCHLSSTRLTAAVKQTSHRQSARPALQQDVGKLASSASTEYRQSRKARQGHRSRVVANATNSIQASYSSTESSKSSLTPVLIAVAIASLGALLFGLHVAIVNGLQDAVSAELGFSGNTGLRGAMVSMVLAGATIGSTAGSGLADGLGRRKSFLLSAVPLVIGSILCATAGSANALLAGRFLCGMGIGLTSAVTPVYISEVAPTHLRGTLGSVNQLVICFGILGALVCNIVIPATQWRTIFALTAIPPVLLFLGMLGQPESPRWLVQKNRTSEAEQSARKLWGSDGASQLGDSKSGGAQTAVAKQSTAQLLGVRGVQIGIALFVLQQFAGINAVMYFSTQVFKEAGIQNAATASAAIGLVNVVGTIIAGSLIEKAGRVQLLTVSFTGMCISMFAMVAGRSLPQLASNAGTIAFAGTVAYVLSFALGAGPVPGLLVPEINTEQMRGRAMSLAMTAHWVCNFAVGQFFDYARVQWGAAGIFAFFGAMCAVAVLFIKSSVPETKGRSLEEVQAMLA